MTIHRIMYGLPFLALSATAFADEAAKQAPDQGILSVLGDLLADGGSVMYVILGISILGTVLFLERAFDLYVLRRLDAPTLLRETVQLVEQRQVSLAIEACRVGSGHPLPAALKAGMLRADLRTADVERAMETEIRAEIPNLTKRVTFLALLANAATLAGLLGTIFGLISAFNSVAMASAAQRQEALAGGISQAMYTTAFGISVALPMLFFHHFLSKRAERIVMEAETGASALVVALTTGSDRRGPRHHNGKVDGHATSNHASAPLAS